MKIVGNWPSRNRIDGERDRRRSGSKSRRTILLCPREKHFTAPSSGWRSHQDAQILVLFLNKNLQPESNILAFFCVSRDNRLKFTLNRTSQTFCQSGV